MRRFLFPFAALLTLGSLSCGGSKDNATPTPTAPTPTPTPFVPVVTTVRVALADTVPLMGTKTTATVTVLDQVGTVITGKVVSWKSSNDSLATVASDGSVSAKMRGNVILTASVDGKAGTGALRVVPTSAYDCDIEEPLGDYIVCSKYVIVDGKPMQALLSVAAQIDLNGDPHPDIVTDPDREKWYAAGNSHGCYTKLKSNDLETLSFLAGTERKGVFVTYAPTIAGGLPQGIGFRDHVVVADFNGDGRDDFFPPDAAENGKTECSFPFVGARTYIYLSTGSGGFQKVWISDSTTTHGYAVGNEARDGFSLVLNNPWNCFAEQTDYEKRKNCIVKRIVHVLPNNTIRVDTLRVRDSALNSPFTCWGADWYCGGGSYVVAIDVDRRGKKDVINFSNGKDGAVHHVWRLDRGTWMWRDSLLTDLGKTSGDDTFTEAAIAADLNGDGFDDFFLAYRMSGNQRVWINDGAGHFQDRTLQWLGSNGNFLPATADVFACDVSNSGKPDFLRYYADWRDARVDLYINRSSRFETLQLPFRAYAQHDNAPTCFKWKGQNGLLLNRQDGTDRSKPHPVVYVTLRSK